ncbi:MAG: hypothetical protein ACFFCW_40165 [Candidatus Hodarchaeota archaeon]
MSEGILLVFIPLVAYFYTFIYNAGFNSVFAIPNEFIEIQLGKAFITLISIAGVLLMGIMLANLLVIFWPARDIIRIKMTRILVVSAPFLWKFFLFGAQFWEEWFRSHFFLYVIIGVGILEFVFPIFRFRDESTYIEKLEAEEDHEEMARGRSLFGILQARIGTPRYILIIALIFGALFAYDTGRSVAIKKKDYQVLQGTPEVVVLRINDDLLICAPFDRSSRKVERQLIIKRLGEKSEIILKKERIGPLKIAVEQ